MNFSHRPATVHRSSIRRVAFSAALLALAGYLVVGFVADLVALHRFSAGENARIADRLGDAQRQYVKSGGTGVGIVDAKPEQGDLDDAPVLIWFISDGAKKAIALEHNTPSLPRRDFTISAFQDVILRDGRFRAAGERVQGGRLVAATSTRSAQSAFFTLLIVELILAPLGFLAVLVAALLIAGRAVDPIERARQQQLAFTADASHELRTPLTVIEAELGLALSKSRDASAYRETLERVSHESKRMRSLIERLLWLSRLEAAPPQPSDELIDLAVIVEAGVDRFRGIAESRNTDLAFVATSNAALLRAPAEWIDQLTGVLVDNACKYAGVGGTVRVGTIVIGTTVELFIEDSGPGIKEESRDRIFDRFHRGDQREFGAGLGLAIADAVVQATQGSWLLARSPLGGARFSVSWQRPQLEQRRQSRNRH